MYFSRLLVHQECFSCLIIVFHLSCHLTTLSPVSLSSHVSLPSHQSHYPLTSLTILSLVSRLTILSPVSLSSHQSHSLSSHQSHYPLMSHYSLTSLTILSPVSLSSHQSHYPLMSHYSSHQSHYPLTSLTILSPVSLSSHVSLCSHQSHYPLTSLTHYPLTSLLDRLFSFSYPLPLITIIIIHSWWHTICQWKHIKIWINWITGVILCVGNFSRLFNPALVWINTNTSIVKSDKCNQIVAALDELINKNLMRIHVGIH